MIQRFALATILAAGFSLRFYHLGTPSLWWDEMVVPLTSSFPIAYILEFSRTCEMHPPFFYLLMKLVMAAGQSDFALRLLPALFGVGSIYLIYRLFKDLFSENVALLSAALLASNALQVWVTRFVRPYSLITFLFLLSFYFLVRYIRNGAARDLWKILLVNATLFCLHYFTFHLAFSEFLVLAGLRIFFKEPIPLKHLAAFCLGTLVVAVPILLIFFLPSQTTLSIFKFQATYGEVFDLIASYLGMLFFRFDFWPLQYGLLLLCLFGAAVMWRRDRKLLFTCAGLVIIPLINQLILKKTAYFSPWHLAYMAPLTILAIAFGLDAMLKKRALVVAASLILCLGTTGLLFTRFHHEYFDEDSYKHAVFVSKFKILAKALPASLRMGDVIASSDPATLNGVNWYLNRFLTDNFFLEQSLGPDKPEMILNFFSPYRSWGHLGKTEEEFFQKTGQPVETVDVANAKVYRFRIPRTPVTRIPAVPFAAVKPMEMMDFYRDVYALKNVTVLPYWEGEIEPTRNNVPGTFDYVFENETDAFPQLIGIGYEYKNLGEGSVIALSYRFDEEPAREFFKSPGKDPKRGGRFYLVRDTPYRRLTVSCRLVCADKTPLYPGGNLETIAFRKLYLDALPFGPFFSRTLDLREEGLGRAEFNETNAWRWGLGPETVVRFHLDEAGPVSLEYVFENPVPGQDADLFINGEKVKEHNALKQNDRISERLVFDGREGENAVIFRYRDWNNNPATNNAATFAASDLRTMAVFFKKLRLEKGE